MRRLAYFVTFVSILSYGPITFGVSPSFSDAAKQVQTDQQSCKQSSNPTDCIKKLSSEYSSLYQAASALASQTIDATNPLAALAQKQLKQYQDIKIYIEQNALGLMNGTTIVPDNMLSSSAATVASPAPSPVMVASAAAKCPNESIVTSLAPATLDAVEADAPAVTGRVQGATSGKVQVCVAGKPLTDAPVAVGSDGEFKATVPAGTKLTNGEVVVAQYIIPGSNGGPDTYGPASPDKQIAVGSCKMDAAKSGIVPTLNISQPDEKGMVTYSGKATTDASGKVTSAAAGTTVRICVNDIPNADAGTPTVKTDGTYDGGKNTFKVHPDDHIVAQTKTPGTTPTYGPLSIVVPISTNLVVGSAPSASNGIVATIVGGVEQSGYSSLSNNTGGFLSAFFRSGYVPLSQKLPLGLAAWGRVRLLSAPQPGTVGIASILTNPTGAITTQTFSSIGTAVDYVVGPELKLKEWDFGSAISMVSLITGVGATTPLSSNSVTVSYAVPPPNTADCEQLIKTYGPNTGNVPYLFKNPNQTSCIWNPVSGAPYSFISFANQNRSNFLFKWGVGGRLTHVYPAKDKDPSYAGSLDVSVGQDSSVTGGKVSGWVFKLDGVYPIPFTGSLLYVFGSAAMRFTHNQYYAPLILANATNAPVPPSTQVAVLSLQQPNRDFYRLGFGLNIATIWCKFAAAGCPQQTTTDTSNTNKTGNAAPAATNTSAPAPQPAPANGKKG